MEYFKLTRDHLAAAKTYLPLAQKEAFCRKNSERCFDRLKITMDKGDELPPLWMENTALKKRYLMTALVRDYLGLACEEEDDLMTEADYDRWAGAHIFMQLERLKKEKGAVCDTCYDLLSDYFELSKMFESQMKGRLNAMNDPVSRQQIVSDMAIKQLPKAMEIMRMLQEKGAQNGAEAVLSGS